MEYHPGQRWVSKSPTAWTPRKDVAHQFIRHGSGARASLLILEGRPSDDACHKPFKIEGYSAFPGEEEAQTPPLTAFLVKEVHQVGQDLTEIRCVCTFSPQLLSELIRPEKEVWKAVSEGREDILRGWLKKYRVADLEYEHPSYKCSVLYSACRFGHFGCVKALTEACAMINSQLSSARSTPLHAASFFGHPEVVEFLLESLADATLRNVHGLTPVEEAAANTRSLIAGLAAPGGQAEQGLKLFANARELRYGSRAGFIVGLRALVGEPVLTFEQEWAGRPAHQNLWAACNEHYRAAGGRCQCLNAAKTGRRRTCGQIWQNAEGQRAGLTQEESLGCILYTGEGYVALNQWLRALGKAVEAEDEAETARLQSRGESYASTVLSIASGMEKLVKSTPLQGDLARGIEGKLPDDFFVPDERGMVTLTEFGFMSTSRSAQVAQGFGGGGVTVIMQIKAKEEDAFGYHNGVDMEWLTMYEGEKETLFPPGTLFDVTDRQRSARRITLTIRPTFLF